MSLPFDNRSNLYDTLNGYAVIKQAVSGFGFKGF